MLSELAWKQVSEGNSESAMKPYTKLQELASKLRKQTSDAEDAAVYHVAYVERTKDRVWTKI